MRYAVVLVVKRTYVVPVEAGSRAEAMEKAETIFTPPAACINRDYRRILSVEPIGLDDHRGMSRKEA